MVYEHYETKENLYLACVRRTRDRYHAGLAEAGEERDPYKQLILSATSPLAVFKKEGPNG